MAAVRASGFWSMPLPTSQSQLLLDTGSANCASSQAA
jgi:hypothetical protein